MDGDARVVDGRAIDTSSSPGPLLIAQCDNAFVLSDVKLALLEHLDPDTPVTVLQRLGLPDEQRRPRSRSPSSTATVEPDHLTSLFVDVDTGAAGAAARSCACCSSPSGCAIRAAARGTPSRRTTRSPATCSRSRTRWSRRSRRCRRRPVDPPAYAALEDELGDLLYQVVFHAVLAEEAGEFTMADVARGIHDKLVRRHPHVFGDVVADETADVVRNWEQIKKDEKGTTSIVEGITPGLPSLLYTTSCSARRRRSGSIPATLDEALDRIDVAVGAPPRRRRTTSRPTSRRCSPPRSCIAPRRRRRRRVRAARLGRALPPPLRGDGAARR